MQIGIRQIVIHNSVTICFQEYSIKILDSCLKKQSSSALVDVLKMIFKNFHWIIHQNFSESFF